MDKMEMRNAACAASIEIRLVMMLDDEGYGYPMYCGDCPTQQACPVDPDLQDFFEADWLIYAPGYSNGEIRIIL